jgi:glycosyltransferase involved in cell wall biosynthesis
MKDFHGNIRHKIGIIFNFSPYWMGGILYIINLIKTLDFLDDKAKPDITLFYRPDLFIYIDEIKYPYFRAVEWKFPTVIIGYFLSWVSGKNIFVDEILRQYDLDALFPLHDYPIKSKTRTKLMSWYADLQHEYYPEFFTRKKIIERNVRLRFMLRNTQYLVVSSQTVADDFERFFRLRREMRIDIFHFVSVLDDFNKMDINNLRKKYKLPEKYFIISNQFHKHKNHKVLLKALALLNRKRKRVHLAMTGRFYDSSHSQYMQELHTIIKENNLQSRLSLMGIIPRKEQLLLMKHAHAVIQPSLFEGWSTVIEDAKSLQVPVIASNIPVNIEQLGIDGIYFDPEDDKKLAEILENFPPRNLNDIFYCDYKLRIREAAQVFLDIFSD